MAKYGFRDPVYCWYNSKNWGNKIKIIVGNNRMVVAKELKIPIVPAVITNFKADPVSSGRTRFLNTDEESQGFILFAKATSQSDATRMGTLIK